MLNTTHLEKECGFEVIVSGAPQDILDVFCGDLMSWAMGRLPENAAWCTVMGNINTVAVASMTDCACIVLCHGAVPMEDMITVAKEQNVNVFRTELPESQASYSLMMAQTKHLKIASD